jgi:hypothetical protein
MMSRRVVISGLALVGLFLVLAGAAFVTGVVGPAAAPPTATGETVASGDPHALTVANVTRSLRDNAGFMPLATLDNLRVTVPPSADEVDLVVRPDLVPDEHVFLLQAGADELVAAKAIVGWYPSIQRISVTLEGTFTDAAGRSTVQPGVSLTLSSATVQAWSSGAVAAPGADTALCYADTYAINPTIWNALGTGDRGCLTTPTR